MDFTPRGVPVDFVMQNTDGTFCKYLGSYYLSENVRVDTNRIEIDELDETITDPDSLEITGGYLIQGGVQKESNSPSVFYTKKDFCLANDTPSFDPADGDPVVDVQKNYIRNYIQEFEDALFSADYEGKNGPSYRDMYTVVPQNVQDKNIVWKSSNEDIASFVSASVVRLHSTGDVTLTGTLKYNSSVKRTLKLHVVDTRPAKVTSLKFNKSVINMHKGKYAHVLTSFVPAGSSMDYLDYVSSNRKVATVDENGIIYGKGPGSATITATGYVFTDDEQIEVKAKCKVNVSLAKKKTNPIVVKGKTVSLKRSVLKKKSRTIKRSSAIKITKGKKTYKLASVSKSKKYFKVSKKTGKITVKKGLKKGTYKLKIKVRAAGDYSYKARTRTASVTIKVK